MSIVRLGLKQLRAIGLTPSYEELRRHPWLTLLLVKLVLEDERIPINRGDDCPDSVFLYCLGVLYHAQGSHERKDTSFGAVFRMLRSMIQPQIMFQMGPTSTFLRWPALIDRLGRDHPCRRHFVERFGVEPRTFMLVTYAAHVPVLNQEQFFSLPDFDPLRKGLGDQVDRVLGEFTRTMEGLRKELCAQRAQRLANGDKTRPHHEINEVPWLVNFPLLQTSTDTLKDWHACVFTRGMDEGVHRRMSEQGGAYTQHFGIVFEKYVVEQIEHAKITYLSERAYWAQVGGDKNAMEAIITDGTTNVLVEAKFTLHSDVVTTHLAGGVVWRALKNVHKAMDKAWKVSERLHRRVCRTGRAPRPSKIFWSWSQANACTARQRGTSAGCLARMRSTQKGWRRKVRRPRRLSN
ncbi:hypothetical protein [Roseateles sp.]|uniref:hypothetical protein n=1 Tax=Roseateles sp. TaxID=1971397 RepID=UPI00326579A5